MNFKNKKLRVALAVLIFAGVIGAYSFLHRNAVKTDDAAFEATVVTVSPKIAGYVTALPVTDNQMVKPGQLLLTLDPADYTIALAKSNANHAAALANEESAAQGLSSTKISAPSTADAAQAQVRQAEANWQNAQDRLKRLQSLTDIARSRQELDDAITEEKQTHAALIDTQAKLRGSQIVPQTVAAAQAKARLGAALSLQTQADVEQARRNIAYTTLFSPLAGRVSARGVEVGDYVQAGQQLLSVVGTDFWIVANYKETQLTRVKPGQPVAIHVDAYPDLKLTGHVDSIQAGTGSRFSAFPAQNATGNFVKIVQRVPVKILLDTKVDLGRYALGPGMSVEPVIDVGE